MIPSKVIIEDWEERAIRKYTEELAAYGYSTNTPGARVAKKVLLQILLDQKEELYIAAAGAIGEYESEDGPIPDAFVAIPRLYKAWIIARNELRKEQLELLNILFGKEVKVMEMTLEEKAHDVRKKIDAIIQYVGGIKNDSRPEYAKGKRELAIAYTKLQEAKMWMGKVLEECGSELPAQYADKAE